MNPSLPLFLDLLVKSSCVVLLGFAMQGLWRGASAAQRGVVWQAVFLVLLLLPLTLLWRPLWSIDLARPVAGRTHLPLARPVLAQPGTGMTAMEARVASQTWQPAFSAPAWAGWLWLAGAAGLLARRGLGSLQLCRLRSSSQAVCDARVLAIMARVAASLGLRRAVALRHSSCTTVPLTWGFIHPVLLLPCGALEWDDVCLEAALRHEAGHIRHLDAPARLATAFITALYWPNMLVWLAARAWHAAQEQAADDIVMRGGASAENYALQLLEAARGVRAAGGLRVPAMAMAQPSTLERRLTAIMDVRRNRSPYSLSGALAGLALSIGVLALCGSARLSAADGTPATAVVADGLHAKANAMILPKLVLRDHTLRQAVAFLQAEAIKLDPQHKGLNLVIQEPFHEEAAVISLNLSNVPISEALRYIAALSNRVVRYEAAATVIGPMPKKGEMVTRSYRMPPGTGAKISNAKEWLVGHGVVFDGAASAVIVADGAQLLVRNTLTQQESVEAIVQRLVVQDQATSTAAAPAARQLSFLEKKAHDIILPKVGFQAATLAEALEFLRANAKAFDPDGKGVSILLREGSVPQTVRITMDLRDVPLMEALRYTSELAGLELVVEPYAFILKARAADK